MPSNRRKDKYPTITRAQRARSLKSIAAEDRERAEKFFSGHPAVEVVYDGKGAPTPRMRLIEGDSAYRKAFPLADGLLDYFPDAMAAVSEVSFKGNNKHNPGEPMHHARGKSTDHANCIMRHLTERGGFDGDIRHSAALAWRALALLQEELENDLGLPLPRGARG
jgi:hypothetical protein